MSAVLVTGRAVVMDDGGRVGVSIVEGDLVVAWRCGDTRTFRPDQLRSIVKTLDDVGDLGEWLSFTDRHGDNFVVRIKGESLQAADHPNDYSSSVDWTDFRKAIKQTLKDRKAQRTPFDDYDEDDD